MSNDYQELGLVHGLFKFEVMKATASLMYLLEGMEALRATSLHPWAGPMPTQPRLSYAAVMPVVGGNDVRADDLLLTGGDSEQLAYKGWVVDVYDRIWDGYYRKATKDALIHIGVTNAISPEMTVLGDLRHIRHDLVHKRGIATDGETGKCDILKWFKPGDRMVLGMRHVFDFMNQMGWVSGDTYNPTGSYSGWTIRMEMEEALRNDSGRELISIRVSRTEGPDGESQAVVSYVFDNGIAGHIPVAHPYITPFFIYATLEEANRVMDESVIDEQGDLRFGGCTVGASVLYEYAINTCFNREPGSGRGIWSGPYRMRR